MGQAGPHKHPPHQLHRAEDVGQREQDVVDLLLQPKLAQLGQDVVEGDLLGLQENCCCGAVAAAAFVRTLG